MKKLTIFLCTISLVFATAGFAKPVSAAETIKIGAIFGLTGVMAHLAEEVQKGFTVALEHYGYEVAGRPIKLIFEDTASEASTALDKARKLVERDKVSIMLGPVHGGHRNGVMGYLERAGIPSIAVAQDDDNFVMQYKWAWSMGGTLYQVTYPVGVYAYEKLGYRTATSLGTDRFVGKMFMKGFYDAFEERGGKIIKKQWFPEGTTEFTPYLVGLGKADLLATWIGDAAGLAAFPQIAELGIDMPIIQPEHGGLLLSPAILPQLGKAVKGIISSTLYVHTLDTPGNKEFVKAFEAKYGIYPGAFDGMAYATMQVALEAIKRTGGDTSPKALSKALSQPVDTVRGRLTFNKDNVAIMPVHIVKIGDDLQPIVLESLIVRSDRVGKKMVLTIVK
jgi:branched-chain amino acid transport system substrate-binding protein